jgi:hypothetical protein
MLIVHYMIIYSLYFFIVIEMMKMMDLFRFMNYLYLFIVCLSFRTYIMVGYLNYILMLMMVGIIFVIIKDLAFY